MAAKGRVVRTFKKRMTVIDFKQKRTWKDRNTGEEHPIFELTAIDEAGAPVEPDGPLESFSKPEKDKLVEYEVSQYEHPDYGTSFTCKPPRSRGSNLGPKVDELRARVEALEARVAALDGEAPNSRRSTEDRPSAEGQPAGGVTF